MFVQYGVPGNFIDVTDKVLQGNRLRISGESNEKFGDPCPGIKKMLKITRNGREYYHPENKFLDIDADELETFDWIAYSLNYPELNLKTRTDAIEHYEKVGKGEGRIGCLNQPKRGVYKAHPYGGLVNQLITLAHSLILGHYTGRDVYYPFFFSDFRGGEVVPLKDILDIVNSPLSSRLVEADVLYSPSFYQGWDGGAIPQGNVIDLLSALRGEEEEFLSIGTPLLPYEPTSIAQQNTFRDIHTLIYKLIISCIRFTPPFYEEAKKYTPSSPYTAVHLRLEDDFLFHPSAICLSPEKLGYSYIHSSPAGSFFATYLGKEPNKLNWVLDKLTGTFSPAQLSLPWKGREINAIVDYIICSQAENFIGLRNSTFSLAIAWKRNLEGKKYFLFRNYQGNLWFSTDLDM